MQIENTLDLSDESPSYPMVPTSLRNPEIILPLRLFWEQRGLLEPPPSHMPEPRKLNVDGARALLDLSWSQRAPQVQPDDINKDPRYLQYPYQEADEYEEDEEDMEVDERASGKAGGTQCPYCHPEATYSYSMADQTPSSPHSIHTDTDMAMEMGGLGMSSSRTETHRVMPWAEPPQKQTRMLSAPGLVSSITKGMTAAVAEILERFAHPPPVDDVADTAIWECFQQQRAAASQLTPASVEASSWVSAFDRLGYRAQTPQKEDQWAPRPKMTPQKVERGCQASRMAGQEPPRSTSQKRQSQSRPRDEVDSKKGCTEGDRRSSKVQVGIDWSNTGIQKPMSKPDPCHPSFKPDPARASSDQQPRVKSSVVSKGSQKQSSSCSAPHRSQESSERQSGKAGSKTSGLTDPEKLELKEKPYHWIVARIHHLDPKGYVEEIHSFQHFHRNSKSFKLKIIAIADWGRKCADVGLHYPIPAFPHYLFNEFARSQQGGGQVPTKPNYLTKSGGDVWAKCTEAWIWMVSTLAVLDRRSIHCRWRVVRRLNVPDQHVS